MRVCTRNQTNIKSNTYTSLVYPRWNEASSNMNTPWKTNMEFQKWIVNKEMSFSRVRFLNSMLVFVGVTFESHRCKNFQIYHEGLLMERILPQSIWHVIPLFTLGGAGCLPPTVFHWIAANLLVLGDVFNLFFSKKLPLLEKKKHTGTPFS